MKKKRNMQDATLINTRSAKKRIAALEERVQLLGFLIEQMAHDFKEQGEYLLKTISQKWINP